MLRCSVVLACLQVSGQQASIRQELQPLLQWSAALAAGKPMPPKEAEAAATARDKATPATLYTLRRAGKDLWGTLAPGVALEASQQLLDTLAGLLVGDVLKKQVGGGARVGRSSASYLQTHDCRQDVSRHFSSLPVAELPYQQVACC